MEHHKHPFITKPQKHPFDSPYGEAYLNFRRKAQADAEKHARFTRRRIGASVAAGLLAVGGQAVFNVLKSGSSNGNQARDTYVVHANDSHYPSGIAGDVTNNSVRLDKLTGEIEAQTGDEAPTGMVIKLPAGQVDPKAIQKNHKEHD